MDIWEGMLMDFTGLREGVVYVRAMWKGEFHWDFVWRKHYLCELPGKDIDRKKIRNVVRKTHIRRQRICLLMDEIRKLLEDKVIN